MDPQMDVLGDLCLLAALMGIVAIVVITALNEQVVDEKCSPHKWSIHPKTNKHTCTKCGFVSGNHDTKGGDYGP